MANLEYIGPLSRFSITNHQSPITNSTYDVVAVLSGLEPHRSLLEQDILARFSNNQSPITNHQSPITNNQSLLLIQGLMNRPNTRIKRGNITLVPYLKDDELIPALLGAKHIIARSGYSTIMDLDALGLLNHPSQMTNHQSPIIELIPTPGQPEQEYLANYIAQKSRKA